jgi:hypothetical protein
MYDLEGSNNVDPRVSGFGRSNIFDGKIYLIDVVLLSVLIFSKPTRVPAGISSPNHACRPLAQARPTPCARAHAEPRGCDYN